MNDSSLKKRLEEQKRLASQKAAKEIEKGMRLALGSGSTAEIFIQELAKLPFSKELYLISTSERSSRLAQKLGLKISPLESCQGLDLSVDGADFTTRDRQLLKGFGGALTREKIAASLAKELWILVDESKLVDKIPLHRIPCEIIPPARGYVEKVLKEKKIKFSPRLKQDGSIFVTDNSAHILDLDASSWSGSLQELSHWLKAQVGILEHGLFLGYQIRVFAPLLDKD